MKKETEKELMKCINKIRNYNKGFEFTISYYKMTDSQVNGMNWVVRKAEELGLIKCISIGHSLEDLRGETGRFCSEMTFVRL